MAAGYTNVRRYEGGLSDRARPVIRLRAARSSPRENSVIVNPFLKGAWTDTQISSPLPDGRQNGGEKRGQVWNQSPIPILWLSGACYEREWIAR